MRIILTDDEGNEIKRAWWPKETFQNARQEPATARAILFDLVPEEI